MGIFNYYVFYIFVYKTIKGMKNRILLLFSLLITVVIFGQSKNEIAQVYFNKAELAMEKIDYKLAKINFNKGVAYLDSITTTKVAQQGAFIYYELKEYEKAKGYASTFFKVSLDKTSEHYSQMLELYVDMEDIIAKKKEEAAEKARVKLAKEKALKKLDSLKKVWLQKEAKMVLDLGDLYSFDKNGIALYKKNGYLGLINDTGEILIAADTYKDVKANEGYYLFIDDVDAPVQLYSYNSNTGKRVQVIEPSNLDEELTDYGVVTLPRGNGRLVMYPNGYTNTLVYDLEVEKFVRVGGLKELFKDLKKNKKIDKYDEKEGTIKIGKKWYVFGGHVGSNVFSLYGVEDKAIKKFLFAGVEDEEPVVRRKNDIGVVGAYHNNKFNTINEEQSLWLNNNGEEASPPIYDDKYKGATKVVPVKGGYHFTKEGLVFLGDKKLEKLEDFLKKNK